MEGKVYVLQGVYKECVSRGLPSMIRKKTTQTKMNPKI